MKTYLILICFVLISCHLIFAQQDAARLVSARIDVTEDFASKLSKLENLGVSPMEFFKSYGISFPDNSSIILEGNNKFAIISLNTKFENILIEAHCSWFCKYSSWFTADMLMTSDEQVVNSRIQAINNEYFKQNKVEVHVPMGPVKD